MSIVTMVYFAGIAQGLTGMLLLLGILGAVAYVGGAAFYCCEPNNEFKDTHPKKAISAIFLCLFVSALIPPEKTIYMMAGASIAQDIASNPKTLATMDKVYKLIDQKLDEQMKSVTSTTQKKD